MKDSHAKVQMRKKVRGLLSHEKEILAELEQLQQLVSSELTSEHSIYAASIVLDYCAAVRGILNDNHGGPLKPPGLRMANALEEVSKSIKRNLKSGKTPISAKLKRCHYCIKRGLSVYKTDKAEIVKFVPIIEKIFNTLDSDSNLLTKRLTQFRRLKTRLLKTNDPIKVHMSTIMNSFEPGLL